MDELDFGAEIRASQLLHEITGLVERQREMKSYIQAGRSILSVSNYLLQPV